MPPGSPCRSPPLPVKRSAWRAAAGTVARTSRRWSTSFVRTRTSRSPGFVNQREFTSVATTFPNLIDGRPVESAERNADINPSNLTRRRRRVRARYEVGSGRGHRRGATSVPCVVAIDAAAAVRRARSRGIGHSRAQGGARPACCRASRANPWRTVSAKRHERAPSSSSLPVRRSA